MLPLATTDPAFVPFFGLMLALVPRLEPVSARFRAPFMVRSWVTTRDRLRRSLGIGCAIAVVVFTTFVGDPQEPAIGIVLAAIALGGFYAALSEAVQSGFAKARDKLHLPLRKIETADSPPPIIGLTWDWSRAAVVVAIALMFGALIALPEDDGLAGAGGGLALGLALSPFVWFGKSSLSAPFQRQREVFRANFRYSLCRGALFSLIVPAVMVGMYLADGDAAFESLESAEDRTSPLLGIVVLSGLLVPWFACASVLIAPCGQHMLATVLLALAGRLPWRPTSFFERMHKLGALRRSGMGYEFRHERFRNTLLGARETRTPNKVAETV